MQNTSGEPVLVPPVPRMRGGSVRLLLASIQGLGKRCRPPDNFATAPLKAYNYLRSCTPNTPPKSGYFLYTIRVCLKLSQKHQYRRASENCTIELVICFH